MAKLTPEQLDQIEAAELANAVAKVVAKKSLTKREADLIARQRKTEFVPNWDELATELGRSRRTLQKWRDRFGKKCPKDKADGRKSIAAWRAFMLENFLEREPEDTGDSDGQPNKAHWDRERSRIEFHAAQFRLEVERKKYVQLNEICSAVGQMLAGFRTALNMLPGSAARWLIGLKDFQAIKERLQTEVDGVLQSLGRGQYLGDIVAGIVAKHFASETPEFQGKLTVAMQQLYIEMGRETLQDLMQREFVECSPPS